jgi:predicted ATPase
VFERRGPWIGLAPVKEVAQIGAVIGREFSHELLAAVSPQSEDKLAEALDQLVTSELVFRRGIPPEATYSFKHALVQDAAYQSLLARGRRGIEAGQNIERTTRGRLHRLRMGEMSTVAVHLFYGRLSG